MKKITVFLICALIFCSTFAFGASAETKNLCETFEKEINLLHFCINNRLNVSSSQSFDSNEIFAYLDIKIGGEKAAEMGEKGYCFVDGETVEARAKSYFLNVDVEKLREAESETFEDTQNGGTFAPLRYNEESKKYVIYKKELTNYSKYVVYGYKQNGDKYDVYSSYINLKDTVGTREGEIDHKDYIAYSGKSYLILYSVKTTVAYKNDTVQFCGWEYDVDLPDAKTLITPKTDLSATSSATSSFASSATSSVTSSQTSSSNRVNDNTIYAQAEDLTISGKANLFPKNTVVKAEKITSGDIYERVKNALPGDTGRYTVYEITAKKGEETVQPSGKITAVFNVPSSFDLDRVKVFYVSPEGKTEIVTAKIDYVNAMVTVELEHFSTYVLAEGGDILDTDGSAAKGSTTIVWIIVGIVAFALLAGGGVFVLLYLNYNKVLK